MRMTWKTALWSGSAASLVLGLPLALNADQHQMPEPEAEAVWEYMQSQNFQDWAFWPGTDGFYEGTEPHGAQLKTYVNSTASEALNEDQTPLPGGSTIVKENYSPDQQLMATTVMYKAEGYNPQHNNWFWMKKLADGTVEASGRVESCQACHSGSDTDYLLSPLQ